MDLIIFNGSPRRKKSNSKILSEKFIEGFNSVKKQKIPVYYLAETKKANEHKNAFEQAKTVIFIFPLYTDCMPAIVKLFFESIYLNCKKTDKNVGFIVQSGFPEAHHSVYLEKYLAKYSKKMNWNYLGTIIKGGVEGIQIMPERINKKLFIKFYNLGKIFAESGNFDNKIKNKLKKPYKLSKARILAFKIFSLLGFTNYYWNYNLKKNNAYKKRFEKPFAK